MDKQEYREIVADIKRAYDGQEYEKLLMYADELELRRVSDARVLEMISDAYEATGQREEAMQVLTRAYEKTPMGRKMAYKLGEMAIEQGDLDKAVEYYEEFSRMAPNDNSRLLLKYKIGKAGNVNKADLAKVLDNYCSKEMDDQWMYELAALYDEMGEREKSVEICDDIILWFAGGDYTEKAYQLKNKGQAPEAVADIPQDISIPEAEPSDDEISEITAKIPPVNTEDIRALRPQTESEEALSGDEMDSILEEYITIEDATADPVLQDTSEENAGDGAQLGDTRVIPTDEIRRHIAQEPAPFVAQAQKFAYSAENMPVIEEAPEEEVIEEAQAEEAPVIEAEYSEEIVEAELPEITDEELEDMISGQTELELDNTAEEVPVEEVEPEALQPEEEEKPQKMDDQLFVPVMENGKPFSNIIAMNAARSAPPKEDGNFWKMPDDLSVEEKEADPNEPVFGSHRWFEKKDEEPEFEEPVYGAHRFVKAEEEPEEAAEEDGEEKTASEEAVTETDFVPAKDGDIFFREEEKEEFVIEEMEPEPIRIEHPKEEPEMTGRISTIKTAATSAGFGAGMYAAAKSADSERVMSDQAEFVKKPAFGQHKYGDMEAVAAEPSDSHILHPLTAHGIWPSTPAPEAEEAPEPVAEPVVEKAPEPVAEPVVEKAPEPVAEPVVEEAPEPVAESEPVDEGPKPFMFQVMPNQPVEEVVPEAAKLAAEQKEEPAPAPEPVPESPVFAKHFEPEVKPEEEKEAEPAMQAEPEIKAEPQINARARQLFMDEKPKAEPRAEEAGPSIVIEEPEKPERAMHVFDMHKEEVVSPEVNIEPKQPQLSGFEKAMKLFEDSQQEAEELPPEEFEDVFNDVVEANKPWEEPEFGLPDTQASEFDSPDFIGNDFNIGDAPWAISDDELEELTGAAEQAEPVATVEPEPVPAQEVPNLAPPIEVTQRVRTEEREAKQVTQRFVPVKERPAEVTQRIEALKKQAEEEAQAEEPVEELVETEAPIEEAVAEEIPTQEPKAEEAPVQEETPVDEVVADEAPAQEEIVEEETPVEEPIEEPADEEAPAQEEVPAEEPVEEITEEPEADKAEGAAKYSIPEEFRDELSEFLIIDGMEERICNTIGNIVDIKLSGDPSGGNLIVTGDPKSGKTYLIISIIKAVGKETGSSTGKVAKVQAEALNGKDMEKVFAKIAGSDLVIENAGYLHEYTVENLAQAMRKDNRGTMVILEGNSLGIENIMVKHPELEELFKTRLDLDELSLSQWADLACEYAQEQGYHIGDMALLALHARIDEMNLPTTRLVVDDVKGIVDDAIRKAGRRGGKRRHRKGKDNAIELDETDFM